MTVELVPKPKEEPEVTEVAITPTKPTEKVEEVMDITIEAIPEKPVTTEVEVKKAPTPAAEVEFEIAPETSEEEEFEMAPEAPEEVQPEVTTVEVTKKVKKTGTDRSIILHGV